MRSASVLFACLLTACSTQAVRCDRHLTPINVLERPIADLAPRHSKEASTPIRGATQSYGSRRMNADRPSADPKHPMRAAGGEGTP